MTTPAQHRAIHALKKTLSMTEGDYRAVLESVTGQTSARALSPRLAEALILHMKGLAGQAPASAVAPGRRASLTVSGKFGKVLQALWLAAWNLGIVENRDDAALLAFVERQTGQPHTRFLVDPALAAKAIEGLKAWIAREAGVEWNREPDVSKRAVCAAIHRRLAERDPGAPRAFSHWEDIGVDHGLPPSFDAYTGREFDRLATVMGAHLRAAMKAASKPGRKRRAA
jgi:hypothetical protein